MGACKSPWGVFLWCLGLGAQNALGGLEVVLCGVFWGVCGALGPKLSGRRPALRNLVLGPKMVILGPIPYIDGSRSLYGLFVIWDEIPNFGDL